jgi:hypothetical protein
MSWHEEHPETLRALDHIAEYLQKMASIISDTVMDEDSMVIISTKIDYIAMGICSVGEANTSACLDDELLQILQGD